MEGLLIIIGIMVLLLIVCSHTADNERKYGYVSLPNGAVIEGWVERYDPDATGMAHIRIKGKTYYTHCSKITLIKK